MLYSSNFSSILWDTLQQANGDEASLRATMSSMIKEDVKTFFGELLRAAANLRRSSIASMLETKSPDSMNDIVEFVVSKGAEYYDRIIDHPDEAPQRVDPNDVWAGGVALQVFWDRFHERLHPQDY